MSEASFRYSERGSLYIGDIFRARGGPTYKDSRVGVPGLYKLIEVFTQGRKTYLVGMSVSKYGVPDGGTYTLYVKGPSYELAGLPGWVVRPYKIQKKRMQ